MEEKQFSARDQSSYRSDERATKAEQEMKGHSHEKEEHAAKCPACQAVIKPGADICESCGKWLLTGQCCFCYSPFKPGQKFCGNCGNSPTGSTCTNCGTASHFHFCPKCDSPISKKAVPALKTLQESPELKAIIELAGQLAKEPGTDAGSLRAGEFQDQLSQLKAYFSTADKSGQTSGPAFKFDGESKDFLGQMQNSAQSMANIQQERKAVDDTALKAYIRQMQEKVFSDNQAARLYYTAIKIMLPELKRTVEVLGWKCNYASFIHYDGPSGCACPGMGGHWVMKTDVKWTGVDSFDYEGVQYTPGNES